MNDRFPLSNLDNRNIILASASPRRRDLLSMLDLKFTVDTSREVDETYPTTLPPEEVPELLAKRKGDAYLNTLGPDDLLISADTIVACGKAVYGKPTSLVEAADMLHSLSGRTHKVITGVAITTRRYQETFAATTDVEFANLTDQEILYYVERYCPLDKAGAYGIQEWIGAIGIKRINGSFYNVMGLPVQRLYEVLKQF